MKSIRFALLVMLSCTFSSLIAQDHYAPLIGHWIGLLPTKMGDTVRIVLTFEREGDSLNVEIDSPDQYAFGLKATSFLLEGDSIHLKVPFATIIGILNRQQDTIAASFMEGKGVIPMMFGKSEERPVLIRPQEPKPPFSYKEDEQVVISDPKDGKPVIKGTLTWPDNTVPKATVVLISGSGWQDRNSMICGHKPFWVIADYLTNEGYAVFRYDDLPLPIFAGATTLDLAYYVTVIVDSLRQDSRCKGVPLGLLGHSEGGLVALIAASANRDIDFVISMAGVGVSFKELMLYQSELSAKQLGFTPQEVEKTIKASRDMYTIMERSKTREKATQKVRDYLNHSASEMSQEEKERYGCTPGDIFVKMQSVATPWFFQLFKIKPKKYLKKIKVPVYALNGDKDVQVNANTNISLMEKYVKFNPENKFEILPDLNHLFQEADTGAVDEYCSIEQTISPLVLDKIEKWLSSLYSNRNNSGLER